jgi:hypothetical protein
VLSTNAIQRKRKGSKGASCHLLNLIFCLSCIHHTPTDGVFLGDNSFFDTRSMQVFYLYYTENEENDSIGIFV